ncbi:MAG: LON peptidase substrate-binding domain-containing protein [Chloroflexi bacterium]|nr:LON peptidase substrate-binding domain-containing protein [Chloroflexota bacterium]
MEPPLEIPVMTLANVILFPQAMLPLYIFEPRYRRMLDDVLHSHRMFALALKKPGRTRDVPSQVAGLGLVRAAVTNKDGTSHLILQGLTRVELTATIRSRPYRIHRIRPLATTGHDSVVVDALTAKVLDLVEERFEQCFDLPVHLLKQLDKISESLGKALPGEVSLKHVLRYLTKLNNPDYLADLVSCTLLPGADQRQTILEAVHLETRLKHLIHFLIAEIRRSKNDQNS